MIACRLTPWPGFLRALEVYEGILFLTTNRVGSFDDAFISRIHVKLFYSALRKSERKKILGNFRRKLEDERGDKMIVTDRAEDYMDGDTFLNHEFNGREIRNSKHSLERSHVFVTDDVQFSKQQLAWQSSMTSVTSVARYSY